MEKYELKKYQQVQKRIFDIIFSTIAIVITMPIMVLISIAIKIDSKGIRTVYKK